MDGFTVLLFTALLVHCSCRKDKMERNITEVVVGHCYEGRSLAEKAAMLVSAELAAAHVSEVIGDINIRIIQNYTGSPCDQIKLAETAFEYFTELGVDLLLGPYCTKGVEKLGVFAAAWDWPVIGYQSIRDSVADKELYPTLGRVSFTLTEFGSAAVDFLEQFKWKKVGYIYREGFPCGSVAAFAELFRKAASNNNVDITIDIAVKNRKDKAELNMALEKIRKKARIVAFCFGSELRDAREFLIAAHEANMMGSEYAYIAIWANKEFRQLPWEYGDDKDTLMKQLFSKILVMLPQGYYYEIFKPWLQTVENVTKERYNVTEPQFRGRIVRLPLIHDGLLLYGRTVSKCLKKPNCNYRSGRDLFDLMRNQAFQGASGNVLMSDKADRVPDYIIQSFREDQWKTHFSLNLVQTFLPNGTIKLNRHIQVGTPFNWNTVDSRPPADTPTCGFQDEKCKTDQTIIIIIVIVIGIIVLIVGLALAMHWNKKKFEDALLAQSWRIDSSELRNVGANFGTSMKSIHSHNSVTSTHNLYPQHGNEIKAVCRGREVLTFVYPKKESIEFTRRQDLLVLKELRDLQHENVNAFIGICLNDNNIKTVWNYCQKEGLEDIVYNNEITLDEMFKGSILKDLIRGLQYIHSSKIGAHGRLVIRNCYVDSRWMVKISGCYVEEVMRPFLQKGAIELVHQVKTLELIEMAPEVVRSFSVKGAGQEPTAEGDIYGLGMIFYHVLFRERPFNFNDISEEDILKLIRSEDEFTVRPQMPPETKGYSQQLKKLLRSCWTENPAHRPTIQRVRNIVFQATGKESGNLVDHMVKIMEQYAKNLEKMVECRTKELIDERERADQLLFRMLPIPVALKLKQGIHIQPEYFESVTLMFADIVGFTNICSQSTPQQVVEMMNSFYSDFDETSAKFDVYKVETIGDAYMVASGLPIRNDGKHATEIADLALAYRKLMMNKQIAHLSGKYLQTRTGIHAGPVAAGVVGMQMPHYCLFGDTVNMASRMESSGLPMKIQLSQTSNDLLDAFNAYGITYRGEIEIKGKGFQPTYWLESKENAMDIM